MKRGNGAVVLCFDPTFMLEACSSYQVGGTAEDAEMCAGRPRGKGGVPRRSLMMPRSEATKDQAPRDIREAKSNSTAEGR